MTPNGIRKARRAKGLSRADLAKLMHVSPVSVEKWEQGTRRPCCQWCERELRRVLAVRGKKATGRNRAKGTR